MWFFNINRTFDRYRNNKRPSRVSDREFLAVIYPKFNLIKQPKWLAEVYNLHDTQTEFKTEYLTIYSLPSRWYQILSTLNKPEFQSIYKNTIFNCVDFIIHTAYKQSSTFLPQSVLTFVKQWLRLINPDFQKLGHILENFKYKFYVLVSLDSF